MSAEGREGKPHRPCMHVDVRWSPEHGGCLMFVGPSGGDCCSSGEGEFPADALGYPPPNIWRAIERARQHLEESPACPTGRTEVTPSAEDWERAERRATGRKAPACSKCGDPSHRLPQCTNLGDGRA